MSATQTVLSDDDDDESLEDAALWPGARLVLSESTAASQEQHALPRCPGDALAIGRAVGQ